MGKKLSKNKKRTVFTSAHPLKMSEVVVVSRALGKLKDEEEARKKSTTLPTYESQWAKAEAAIDGYGVFHEEAERTVRTRNGLPVRKWEWKPRNSYPKWVKEQARLRKKNLRKGTVKKVLRGVRLGVKINKGAKNGR